MSITVNLLGGLGNQMFQYAIGKNIALANDDTLILDLTNLLRRDENLNHTHREFELDFFNISAIKKIYPQKKNSFKEKCIRRFFTKYINETHHIFDPTVLNNKGNIYLTGFWQNVKYFEGIEPTIRNEFQFKTEPDSNNKLFLTKVQNCNSISIHFRRGDYITNKNSANYHGTCSNEYYKNAIIYIKKHVKNPHFFIFSDEINWVEENFNFEDEHTFVDINSGGRGFEDMRLMSHCKHNIIANSSFSWWAAWLNTNLNKIVIAPKTWFVNRDTDIVPNYWVKIDN